MLYTGLASTQISIWHSKTLDMSGIPVGTSTLARGEPTDSNETIPDGGRGSVRMRLQEVSVSAGLLQPLHQSREHNSS